MSEVRSGRGAAAAPSAPAVIRNVALVGPLGSGKTTLLESLLHTAGVIDRRGCIADGTTVGDADPAARSQSRSVGLSFATLAWRGTSITVVDTPGHPDFVSEVRAGLRAVDAALFVVSAVGGIDTATARLWDECAFLGLPRAIVVTGLDRSHADFDETTAVCRRILDDGNGVIPLVLPIHGDDESVIGFIDLISEQIWEWSEGTARAVPSEDRHRELIAEQRDALLEAIVTESEDESLLDSIINGTEPAVEDLVTDLERSIARGHLHPVLGHAVTSADVGSDLILDLIARGFPSPRERPMPLVTAADGTPIELPPCDSDGPLVAEVVRTTTDAFTGRMSVVRVFSGTLVPEDPVRVMGHSRTAEDRPHREAVDKPGHLSTLVGVQATQVTSAVAGSIVAVERLVHAETGDTLSPPDRPMIMEPWVMPEPLLPMAIRPHSARDDDRLAAALARILAEDVTVRLDRSQQDNSIVLWTLGEAHADLVLDRLTRQFGVEVEQADLLPALRATFGSAARGTGRIVKQSGGHGQYAVVDIEVAAAPRGTGLAFHDAIAGDGLPRAYLPAIEKGIQRAMASGVGSGIPLVDLSVTVVGGRAHAVDSSDAAFQNAAAQALLDAASRTAITILEPVARVVITVPEEHLGAVLSDLASRRAAVQATLTLPDGDAEITAVVPEEELSRYAIDIRSITHGSGEFHREPAGYAQAPSHIARRHLQA